MDAAGIKPIVGLEAYLVDDRRERDKVRYERNHLTLLAETNDRLVVELANRLVAVVLRDQVFDLGPERLDVAIRLVGVDHAQPLAVDPAGIKGRLGVARRLTGRSGTIGA